MLIPQPELWLIDWVICGQGESVTGEKLGSLMSWGDLRERVWRAQISAELATQDPSKPAEAELDLTPAECDQLMAIIPTTFRWGTGEDCGFSLKRKIAQELWGSDEQGKQSVARSLAAIFGKEDTDAGSTHHSTYTNPRENPAAYTP